MKMTDGKKTVEITMKVMKRIKIAAVAALAMMLTACGQKVTAGEVTDKQFTAEHISTHTYFIHAGKTSIPMIRHIRVPDCWAIEITGIVDGEEKSSTYEVTEEVYDSLEIGDWYEAEVNNET